MATKGQVYDKKSTYEPFRISTDFADCSFLFARRSIASGQQNYLDEAQ